MSVSQHGLVQEQALAVALGLELEVDMASAASALEQTASSESVQAVDALVALGKASLE